MHEVTIELEKEVVEACEQRVKGTEFNSVEDYIAFITTEAISVGGIETIETRDLEDSENQLRALGYLD